MLWSEGRKGTQERCQNASDLKSALKSPAGKAICQDQGGPWGFQAAEVTQHSLKMCRARHTGPAETKLRDRPRLSTQELCVPYRGSFGPQKHLGDRKGGREGLDVVA